MPRKHKNTGKIQKPTAFHADGVGNTNSPGELSAPKGLQIHSNRNLATETESCSNSHSETPNEAEEIPRHNYEGVPEPGTVNGSDKVETESKNRYDHHSGETLGIRDISNHDNEVAYSQSKLKEDHLQDDNIGNTDASISVGATENVNHGPNPNGIVQDGVLGNVDHTLTNKGDKYEVETEASKPSYANVVIPTAIKCFQSKVNEDHLHTDASISVDGTDNVNHVAKFPEIPNPNGILQGGVLGNVDHTLTNKGDKYEVETEASKPSYANVVIPTAIKCFQSKVNEDHLHTDASISVDGTDNVNHVAKFPEIPNPNGILQDGVLGNVDHTLTNKGDKYEVETEASKPSYANVVIPTAIKCFQSKVNEDHLHTDASISVDGTDNVNHVAKFPEIPNPNGILQDGVLGNVDHTLTNKGDKYEVETEASKPSYANVVIPTAIKCFQSKVNEDHLHTDASISVDGTDNVNHVAKFPEIPNPNGILQGGVLGNVDHTLTNKGDKYEVETEASKPSYANVVIPTAIKCFQSKVNEDHLHTDASISVDGTDNVNHVAKFLEIPKPNGIVRGGLLGNADHALSNKGDKCEVEIEASKPSYANVQETISSNHNKHTADVACQVDLQELADIIMPCSDMTKTSVQNRMILPIAQKYSSNQRHDQNDRDRYGELKENIVPSSNSSVATTSAHEEEGDFVDAPDLIESLVKANTTWLSFSDQASDDSGNASDVEAMPSTSEFKRHKWAKSSSSNKIPIGRYGSLYEGDSDGGQMSGLGCWFSGDQREFVTGKWLGNRLIDLHSCQFECLGREKSTIYMRKQAGRYLLSIDEQEFVAKAVTKSFQAVDFSQPFLKGPFFDNVTITHVIENKLQYNRDVALERFEDALKNSVSEVMDSYGCAAVLMMLNKYSKENSAQIVLSAMQSNQTIPAHLRDLASLLLTSENLLFSRKLNLLKFSSDCNPSKLNLKSTFQSVYIDNIKRHRQMLVKKCPSSLPGLITMIWDISNDKILYVSLGDIEVFKHLASLTEESNFQSYVEYLRKRFFEQLMEIKSFSPPKAEMPLIFPVYGFIFKSFLEIVTEICNEASNCSFENMLTFKRGKWKLFDKIDWHQNTKAKLSQKALVCQYEFVFKLLNHFEPKLRSNAKKFDYTFKILGNNSDQSWLSRQYDKAKRLVGITKHFSDLPEERLIWLYLLDHTVDKVFTDATSSLDLFNALLVGFIEFMMSSQADSFESFRVVTHSILKFMTQTIPYFKNTGEQSASDITVLDKQMNYIMKVSRDMGSNSLAPNHFRDLINEYNRYWCIRQSLVCPQHLTSKITKLHDTLLQLVISSLEKPVPVLVLVSYIRSLNDFLDDFKDIEFLSMWYVKHQFYKPEGLEKVDNDFASETENCSYRVTDVKTFMNKFSGDCPAPHYVIQILETLLKCATDTLSKQWVKGNLSVCQLEGTGMILDAMRSSFLYLKEQPDYRDFDSFEKESTEPFKRVIAECQDLVEFKTRVGIVKESFWYIRKMNEIGIKKALKLWKECNRSYLDTGKLRECYDLYLGQYDRYIAETVTKSHEDGVNYVINSMLSKKPDHQRLVKKWDESFKTKEIPTILAGLSSVWSLMVSKDVSSTGKFLKPHCIQILCILRLLSIESSQKGTENHLAQVLTGQGKSVVLGLLSTILAYTGNKVRVLCYSEYLASRDRSDFEEFFRKFGVYHQISYGTFDNVANEFVNPTFQGKKQSLRSLVKSLVLDHCDWNSLGSPTSDASNTVLLIDEVDVFFSEDFYGNTYNSCVTFTIPGLPEIQEKIWQTASGSNYERKALFDLIAEFIDDEVKSGNPKLKEYNKFRLTPKKFSILVYDDDLETKEFTNRTLLEDHLYKMIDKAISVAKGTETDWYINGFKLIDGVVHKRKSDGIYSSSQYNGYYNTFNYFRLKKSGFDHKGLNNYGYLILDTGVISYAKLPEEYPLILGVSGTLSDLCAHEKKAIESYSIRVPFSVLPSFFGDSKLEFKRELNFCVLNSLTDWRSKIFEHINTALKLQRSILVFFDTEIELNNFKKDYGNRYDRLNVLTENTSESLKSLFVNESGIANTVTLVTRGMGRGVDFKSSVAVEKKGGVHVIQTFFSLDVKEETQIKGRTARKDNKGSYELILCKTHLVQAKLLMESASIAPDYSSLHATRIDLMARKGENNADRIKNSESKHKKTMEFFGISAKK